MSALLASYFPIPPFYSLLVTSSFPPLSHRKVLAEVQASSDLTIHLHCCAYRRLAEYALPSPKLLEGGKVKYLLELLPKLRETGHRALVFSQVRACCCRALSHLHCCCCHTLSRLHCCSSTPPTATPSLADLLAVDVGAGRDRPRA